MKADTCPVCGAGTIADARFCHSCGTTLDAPVLDVARRSTFSPATTSNTGGGQRLLMAVGVIALIALGGALVLSGPDDPDETGGEPVDSPTTQPLATSNSERAEATATQPSNELILELRDPLEWQLPTSLGETWPLAIVELDDRLYMFGASQLRGFGGHDGAGLDAWVSDDGGTGWAPLGTVIAPPHLVNSVVGTSTGLAALGTDSTTGSPMMWQSTDGSSWLSSPLPVADPEAPGSGVWPQTIVTTDLLTVVFGSSQPDIERLLAEALPDEFKEATRYGLSWGGPPFKLTLHGPLGLAVFSATAEELGLSDQEQALLNLEPAGSTTVWSSSDGVNWRTAQIDAQGVNSAFVSPDGVITAIGFGPRGMATWESADGVEWEQQSGSPDTDVVTRWNDSLVGSRHRGRNAELTHSVDGKTWTSFAVGQLLDDGLSWHFFPIAAGPAGVAAIAQGYDHSGFEDEPDPLVLERDGYVVISDRRGGPLILNQGETEVLRLSMHREGVHDEAAVDFIERTVTFLDPRTGDGLVTFTFDEIEAAQAQAFEVPELDGEQHLLFSPDGSEWSVQPVQSLHGLPLLLHVTEEAVVAVVQAEANNFSRNPTPPAISVSVAPTT